jgi:hypothetical protein
MYREYVTNKNCAGHPKGYSPEDRLGKNIKDCRQHKKPSKDHPARSSQT